MVNHEATDGLPSVSTLAPPASELLAPAAKPEPRPLSGRPRAWWRLDRSRSPSSRIGRQPAAETHVESRPAKVLFINQYYWPDHSATAQHLTDLAESLAARGHEVHVVCSKGPSCLASEEHNGVRIHRLSCFRLGRRNTLTRMADYLSFYARAAARALTLPRFDAVVTLTTPPLIGLVGTLAKKFKHSKHIYWSMDLHPDASLALGRMSKRQPAAAALAALSDAVYRAADRVVALGPYMADRLEAKGVRPGTLAVIPVWSRRDEIFPLPRNRNPMRQELGLGDAFVAMYSGNLGLAHSFDEFLEAARRLRHRRDIAFVFVGEGPRRAEVEAAKVADGLENVRLLDYVPREQLYVSLTLADVHLISMRREMTGIVVPSKLYGAMASSRPVIFVGPEHCEVAETIRDAGCGETVRLGDVETLVESLERLASDPELAERWGENGRIAFLQDHERDVCCDQWADLVESVVRARTTTRRRLAAAS